MLANFAQQTVNHKKAANRFFDTFVFIFISRLRLSRLTSIPTSILLYKQVIKVTFPLTMINAYKQSLIMSEYFHFVYGSPNMNEIVCKRFYQETVIKICNLLPFL